MNDGVKLTVGRPDINKAIIPSTQISDSTSVGRTLLASPSVQSQRQSLSFFPTYNDYADLVANGPQQPQRVYVTTDNWKIYSWVPSLNQYKEVAGTNDYPAFSVTNLNNSVGPINAGNTITYNTILCNRGNTINTGNGIFTAPISGFYNVSFDGVTNSTTYQDNFTTNPSGLNGRTTATGFGNWVTSDNALQASGGLLTVGSNSPVDYHAATFALPTLSGADVLEISVTARPVGTFLGIGFTPGSAQFVNGMGLSWLYIDAGGVQIFRGIGSNDPVSSPALASFNANFNNWLPTTYTFTYNPTRKTMGLKAANGSSEFGFFNDLDIAGLPPLRNFALMFQGQNLATDANPSYVSNIRADVVPASGTEVLLFKNTNTYTNVRAFGGYNGYQSIGFKTIINLNKNETLSLYVNAGAIHNNAASVFSVNLIG